MNIKSVALFALSLISMTLTGCGISTTSTSSFRVRMHGIYSPPSGASGNSAPRSQTFLFKALTLTKSDGTPVSLYDGEAQTFKVIDRGQQIYINPDMSAYDGTAFSSALIQFDPTVVVTSKAAKDSAIALSSGDLQIDEAFTISKGKEQVLTIKIAWGDTVNIDDAGNETISPPTFSMKYESGN